MKKRVRGICEKQYSVPDDVSTEVVQNIGNHFKGIVSKCREAILGLMVKSTSKRISTTTNHLSLV
jgi:hypothetical protein